MATKTKTTKTVKAQKVYAGVTYGGGLKSGVCVVEVGTDLPDQRFEDLKEFYGDDIKLRYVKCEKPLDSVQDAIFEDLESCKLSKMLFKQSVTEIVKILKKATDAKKCTTLGVYTETETEKDGSADDGSDEEVEQKSTKKTEEVKQPKKVASKEVEAKVEAKDTKKSSKKVEAKVEVKVESDEEEEVEVKAKPVAKKTKETKETKVAVKEDSKLKVKSKSSKVDIEDDLDDIPVKSKGKTVAKQLSKTAIVLSDEDEEEEENDN